MKDIILLKMGELVLKGLNRRSFEQRLIADVKRKLRPYGSFRVYALQSAVYIEPEDASCDMEGAFGAMHFVFGAVAVTRAAVCPKDADEIFRTARDYLKEALETAKSFKVESKRADKSFPMTSIRLSQYVGGLLHDAYPHLKADMHAPEFVVNVEVRDYAAYVHGADEAGAGGLPVGSNGSAAALLSGGIDSPVAAWMMAKRGLNIVPVHFFSFPYTSEQAKEKVLELTRILSGYCGRMRLRIVPFTHIQEEIRQKCPEGLFTVVMRRFMMRIAEELARANGCGAIVTGESLGQVASQTMQAMQVTGAVCALPVLRPLVGMDKEEIVRAARKIGTFETSILPYEDCCTLFTPRHPRTKPRPEEVEAAEAALDVAALVAEAVKSVEVVNIT